MGKRHTKTGDVLQSLSKNDIYSMLLFTLYKLKDNPEYLPLTELVYILQGDDLLKFLSYFGGMTITIPTISELRTLMHGLLLYQKVDLENEPFEESLKSLVEDEVPIDALKVAYSRIIEVMHNYEFNRE